MSRWLKASFLAIPFCLALTAEAQESKQIAVNRALSDTVSAAMLRRADFAGADGYLRKHLTEDPDDARAWNSLGLVQLELKDLAGARESFGRAANLATGDDKAVYLYNAADAANRAGLTEDSRAALVESERNATVLLGIGDQVERTRLVLRAGEALPPLALGGPTAGPRNRFGATAAIKGGYDSNVSLLPDSANRHPEPSSPLVAPSVFAEYAHAFSAGTLAARSSTAFTFFTGGNDVQQFGNLFESAAVEFAARPLAQNRLSLSVGDRYEPSLANQDQLKLFSWTDSVYVDAAYRLTPHSSLVGEVPVGYQKFPGAVIASPDDDRKGMIITPSVLYRLNIDSNTLSGGFVYQDVQAHGVNFRSHSYGLLYGASRPLVWNVSARLGVGYTWTNYPESMVGRNDQRLDVTLTLAKVMPFDKRMTVGLDYIYGNNSSSIVLARYEKHVATLQVTYALF